MHPCCAMLSCEMKFPVHPHPLKLLPPSLTTSSSGDPAAGFTCSECKRKRLGRVYRCTRATDQHCDYYLHAVCAKSFINGLQANGIKNSDTKPSMLGPAARVASQVIIEFIGGLFEGFGEAVGQALIQNMARGRVTATCDSTCTLCINIRVLTHIATLKDHQSDVAGHLAMGE
ncbi:hypothetical protein RJ639_008913 [Escallonia herrerae]|uniref:DC1 domain-containing protein n=1 Tax=Escallonia herrerae TaxID=1293975 RepID=A0AA88VSQ7_9ASTE|nr:hypothetical protein RJ639_008913 [Escallonia herrerae]